MTSAVPPLDAQPAGPSAQPRADANEASGSPAATVLTTPDGTLLPPLTWFERCARLSALPLPLAQGKLVVEPCDLPGDGTPPAPELAPWLLRIDAGRLGEVSVRLGEPGLAVVGSMLGPAFAPGSQPPTLAAALLEFGAAPGLDAVDAALQLGGRLTLCSLEPLPAAPPEAPHGSGQPRSTFWLALRPSGRPDGAGAASAPAPRAWLGLTPAQWDAVLAVWPAAAAPPSPPPALPLDRVIGHTGLPAGVLRSLAAGDWIVIDEPVGHHPPADTAGSDPLAPCPGCLLVCAGQTLAQARATPTAWVLATTWRVEAAASAAPDRPDIEARAGHTPSPLLEGSPNMTTSPEDPAAAGDARAGRIDTDRLPVHVEFRLPALTSTVADVGRWRPGDVLGPLVAADLDDIALYVGPHCIGKGRLLKLDNDWGVQLTELHP
jgi:flagellar motor switch/type III secretory pathway protein FliN